MVSCQLQSDANLLLQFTNMSIWLNDIFSQKKSLLKSKRLANSAVTSYLSAYADGFSTFPITGVAAASPGRSLCCSW